MRSNEIFASMSPEQAAHFCRVLAKDAPGVFNQAVQAACAALKMRPVYLQKQPFEKRAETVRKALSRLSAHLAADEIFAVYFLECRKDLLTEWLDLVGLEHEDGILKTNLPSEPSEDMLKKAVADYRAKTSDADRTDRELLLKAFAAQGAIEWPTFEALLK